MLMEVADATPQVAGKLGARDGAPDHLDCDHAARCPGCALIDRPLAAQLAAKAERVARAFARVSRCSPRCDPSPCAPPIPSPTTARARSSRSRRDRASASSRAARTRCSICPGCRVLAPAIAASVASAATPARRAAAGHASRCCAPRATAAGRLRAVDLREVRDARGAGVLLTLVLRAPSPSQRALDAACEALQARAPVAARDRGVAARRPLAAAARRARRAACAARRCIATSCAPARPGRSPRRAASRRRTARRPRAIHAEIERALGKLEGLRVLDVFAGSGALGLALAARGREGHAGRVVRARRGSGGARGARAGTRRARRRARGARGATKCRDSPRRGARFDAAVVNPPRRGVAPRVREALAATLRRTDRLRLVRAGDAGARSRALRAARLVAERVVPFDLMPQTAEVECVALLRRGAIPALVGALRGRRAPRGRQAAVPRDRPASRASGFVAEARAHARAAPSRRWRCTASTPTRAACACSRSAPSSPPAGSARSPTRARAKRYLALVRGVARESGRIASPLREGGRALDAATRYRRLEVVAGHALLEVTLETGRTHQIRRHLAAIGEPVLGDERHGHAASNRHLFERHFLDRPFLHCTSIELRTRARRGAAHRGAARADLAAVLRGCALWSPP